MQNLVLKCRNNFVYDTLCEISICLHSVQLIHPKINTKQWIQSILSQCCLWFSSAIWKRFPEIWEWFGNIHIFYVLLNEFLENHLSLIYMNISLSRIKFSLTKRSETCSMFFWRTTFHCFWTLPEDKVTGCRKLS